MNHYDHIANVFRDLEQTTGTLSTRDKPQESRVIKTGIEDFDTQPPYGLRRGSLTVLAGRPGIGKSSLASQIVLNAALAYDGSWLIFSPKTERFRFATRLIHQHSKVRLYPSELLKDAQKKKIAEARKLIETLPIFIDDSPAPSAMQVVKRVWNFTEERRPGLVVIDSLECMTPTFAPNVSDKEWGKVMCNLRLIAETEDVPVILIANLDRKVECRNDKRPRLSDLPHPAIAAYADQIMFLYREDYYSHPDTPRKNLAEIQTYSDRYGYSALTHCRFIPEYYGFEDLVKDEPA